MWSLLTRTRISSQSFSAPAPQSPANILWLLTHPKKVSTFLNRRRQKCVVRPVFRDVVFLPEQYKTVPQKGIKAGLHKQGRIKSLIFKRTMTTKQVRATIMHEFRSFHCSNIKFLMATRDHKLVELAEMNREDVCGKRGAVYVYQVMVLYVHVHVAT